MGDRTWARVTHHDCEQERVNQIFGNPDSSVMQDYARVSCYDELNWGGGQCAQEMIEAHIPFVLDWGTGGSYGPGSQAYNGLRTADVIMSEDDHVYPLVPVLKSGKLSRKHLAEVKQYMKIKNELSKLFSLPAEQYMEFTRRRNAAVNLGRMRGKHCQKERLPRGIFKACKEVENDTDRPR